MATSTTTTNDKTSQAPGKSAKANSGFGQGAMIGVAAAGLLAGILATVGRKVAAQAPTAMAGDWLEALTAEHRATLKLLDKIEATTNEQTTKRSILFAQLKHALTKHAFEEENVVYPALRDHHETEDADHLNHDHGYVKQFLYDLAHTPKSNSAWLDKVRELRIALETHMREEEDTIFPALRSQLADEANGKLTTEMNLAGLKLA